ncbi:NAD(+)/NADH kinase [Saccharomonospora sp. NPDC046836]|uniref:NAD(+)/NADH kinase n=1 Tax=Saccharomonospora sp. NPDC046836 TaxID=3156921 RepID=UPI0033F565B9
MGRPATTVGVVANPASGRDIRRLVAQASVFPTAEKANMVQRLLAAFASVGVARALLSTDLGGISSAVLRALRTRRPGRDGPWPDVEFCDADPITGTAEDTTNAVRHMVAAGAQLIVCLGGDGTARVATAACGHVPLLALSTGTNNAFPRMREATVAGLAGQLCPSSRDTRDGVMLSLAPPERARWVVHAPIAPGLVVASAPGGGCRSANASKSASQARTPAHRELPPERH